jgi:hypothetical protein
MQMRGFSPRNHDSYLGAVHGLAKWGKRGQKASPLCDARAKWPSTCRSANSHSRRDPDLTPPPIPTYHQPRNQEDQRQDH